MKRLKSHIHKHGKNVSNHVKKHHKKYLIGGFGIFGIIKMVMLMFSFMAGYQLFEGEEVLAYGDDGNYDFVDGIFKSGTPADDTIVEAFYGKGSGFGVVDPYQTAYTHNWTGWNGECNTGNMEVVFISAGAGKATSWSLTGNTIYVLAAGHYNFDDGIFMNSCNVIVGNGDVYLHSNTKISAMIYNNETNNLSSHLNGLDSHEFNIVDNIHIDGINDKDGIPHQSNSAGIFFSKAMFLSNFTMNNVRVYGNEIGVDGVLKYGLINNSKIFNNTDDGLRLAYSDYGIINNSQFYNNNNQGLDIGYTDYLAINNSQFYNNTDGLSLDDASYFVLNNNHFFNNDGAGIDFDGSISNFFLNNISSYNNNTGINFNLLSSHSANKYYGIIKMFDNIDDGFDNGGLSIGTQIGGLGRDNGTINTGGCMSCDWVTNPRFADGDSRLYRLLDDTNFCDEKGYIGLGFAYGSIGYYYGASISKQIQPVIYSGGQLELSNVSYEAGDYITSKSDATSYSGYACDVPFVNLISFSGNIEYDSPFTFEWDGSSEDGFWFEIDNDSDFSTPLIGSLKGNNIYSAQLTLDSYSLNIPYYWRVINQESPNLSGTWSFTLVDTILPEVTLANPSNNATITNSSRTFSWSSSDNYGVSGSTLYINDVDKGTTLSSAISVNGLVNGTNYEWYVVTEDVNGNTGISDVRTFDVDTSAPQDTQNPETIIRSPAAGSTYSSDFYINIEDTDNMELDESACEYKIEDNGTETLAWFNRVCNDDILIDISEYCPTDGDSICKVYSKAVDMNGNEDTDNRVFSIDTSSSQDTEIPVVENILPLDGAGPLGSGKIQFKWSGSDNVGIVNYILVVKSGGVDYLTEEAKEKTGLELTLPNGDYTYYVVAEDIAENSGQSQPFSFEVNDSGEDSEVPVVENISPGDSATTTSNNVSFVWSGSDNIGVISYTLYIDDPDNVYEYSVGLDTGYVVNLANGVYRWVVLAEDDAGNIGISSSWRVNVDAGVSTPPPVPSMFELDQFDAGSSNTVHCYPVTDPEGESPVEYQFCINTGDTIDGCITGGWDISTGHEFTGLLDATKYYYFVQAKDSLGNMSEWSDSVSSTQDASPPAMPTLSCTYFSDNITGSYTGEIVCSVNDTSNVSPRTEVGYNFNDSHIWTSTDNELSFSFTPQDGITKLVMRVVDLGGGRNSAVYTIIKNTGNPCDGHTYWWDNDNFITGAFWDHIPAPDSCDIVAALYGTSVNDVTAYTESWSGYDGSCSVSADTMTAGVSDDDHAVDSFLDNNSGGYFVLILTGDYGLSSDVAAGVELSDCSAVISNSGKLVGTYQYFVNTGIIYSTGNEYVIIDNLIIDGEINAANLLQTHATDDYGIKFDNVDNFTINNVTVKGLKKGINIDDSDYGLISNVVGYDNDTSIYFFDDSDYNILKNSELYNNGSAISMQFSNNNVIDNSLIYNNSFGLENYDSHRNSINNTQIFNNDDTAFYVENANNWSINNTQLYNNDVAVELINSIGFVFNDMSIYNNYRGVNVDQDSSNNYYYGMLTMFGNYDNFGGDSNGDDGYFNGGVFNDAAISGLGRSDGSINSNECMSCDWYTNPKNSLGVFMMNTGSYPGCTGRNNLIWTGTDVVNYMYGSDIIKQSTGVIFDSIKFVYADMFYDASKYIGEINSLGTYSGDYSCTPDIESPTVFATNNSDNWKNTNIDITLNVSDDSGLSTGFYSWTGLSDCWNNGTDYSSGDIINLTTNRDSVLYLCAEDTNGNKSNWSGVYKLDKFPPMIELISSSGVVDTEVVNLLWSGYDPVSGISGYNLFVEAEFVLFTTDTGFVLSGLNNQTYHWSIEAIDRAGNTRQTSNNSFSFVGGPDISVGYIYSGNTVFNIFDYYNGIVDIKADVSDVAGISGDTCEYTINGGTNREIASYSGTSNTGFCYTTGIDAPLMMNIQFKVKDINQNISISTQKGYIYDGQGPTTGQFNINNNSQYATTGVVDLVIDSCPIEEQGLAPHFQVGLSGLYISNDPIRDSGDSFYECNNGMIISNWELSGDQGTNTVYMRGVDKLGNLSEVVTDDITLDTISPTVTLNTTAPANISGAFTVTAEFSELVTSFVSGDVNVLNGSAGTWNAVDGNTYTFMVTPNAQGTVTVNVAQNVAEDIAGNGNIVAIVLSRTYDSEVPVFNTAYIANGLTGFNATKGLYYYKGDVEVRADFTDVGGVDDSTCEYTINNGVNWNTDGSYGGTVYSGYCNKINVPGGDDLFVGFGIEDSAGNIGYASTGMYYFDDTPPEVLGTGLEYDFVYEIGTGGWDKIISVKSDGENIYVFGSYSANSIDLGGHILSNTDLSPEDNHYLYLAKISSEGDYLWVKDFGAKVSSDMDDTNDLGSMDLDEDGNILVVGAYESDIVLGSNALSCTGDQNVFVTKVSPDGNHLWSNSFGSGGYTYARTLISKSGYIYFGGFFETGINFGNETLFSSGNYGTFVVKMTPDGSVVRANTESGGTKTFSSIRGVDVDNSGNVYFVGEYRYGDIIFGNTLLSGFGTTDIFVVKMSPTGEYLWAKAIGSNSHDYTYAGLVIDDDGNVYLPGIFAGSSITLGSNILLSEGGGDLFVTKISSAGEYLWVKTGASSTYSTFRDISMDDNGNLYLFGGSYNASVIDFDGHIIDLKDGERNFIVKMSSDGDTLMFDNIGGRDIGGGEYYDGNIYIGGEYYKTGFFHSTTLVDDSIDSFITKMSYGEGDLFKINNDDAVVTGIDVILNINCPTDAGVGGEKITYSNTTIKGEWVDCESEKSWVLTPGDSEKTVYMWTKDSLGNITHFFEDNIQLTNIEFTIDLESEEGPVNSPFVVTGTFSTGTNDFTGGDVTITGGYISGFNMIESGTYIWEVVPDTQGEVSVQIDADVAKDSIGRSNTVSNQISVIYDTVKPVVLTGDIVYSPSTLTSGDVTATITLNETGTVMGMNPYIFTGDGVHTFEFRDLAGNTGEVTAEVTWIDKDAPTFDFENSSGYECQDGSLTISNRSDGTGAGIIIGSAYSLDGSNWSSDISKAITAGQPGTRTITGWVRDTLGNSGYKTATYTFNDVLPTLTSGNMIFSNIASPTSGNESIDNILTYLGATEGSCGNTNITGQLVSCTLAIVSDIVGNSLNIVPNADTEGTGVCTIEFEDNESNIVTGFVTYYVDTKAPAAPDCNPEGTSFAGSIPVSCTGNDGTIRYTTGGETPTCGSEERGDISFTETTILNAVQCDDTGNISSVTTNEYTLNNDDFTVGLTSNVGVYVNDSFMVTGMFNTGASDFNSGKIDITNGTITNFSIISDTVYTWEVQPNNNGNTTTVKINSGEVMNDIGAKNIESNMISTTYDVTAPVVETGEIIYSPAQSEGRINGDVKATLSGYDEEIIVTNPSSGVIYHDFIENDTFTFEFSDLAGNTGEVTAEVTWIDKEEPTFSGVKSGVVYSGNRTILFEDDNLSGAKLTGLGGDVEIDSGYLVSGTNTYVLYIEDEAGNSTGAIFEMDNTAPDLAWIKGVSSSEVAFDEIEVAFDDAVYSGYKLVTIGSDCNGENLTGYTGAITYNTTDVNNKYFCAYGRDAVGNSAILVSDTTFNINTSAATIQVTDNFDRPRYTGQVTMTGFNISGDINYKVIEGSEICDTSGGATYTEELIFTGESDNGRRVCAYAETLNPGEYTTGISRPIDVDRTAPVLSEEVAVTPTGNDTTPSYTFSSNEAGTIIYGGGCTGDSTDAVSGDNQIEFEELSAGLHDTCTIQVVDVAGNVSNVLEVSDFYIDLLADDFTISDNVNLLVTNSDRIEVTRGNDNTVKKRKYNSDTYCQTTGSLYPNNYTNVFYVTETGHNGEYICFYAEDALGNPRIGISDNVLNIDITKPTATVVYTPGSGNTTNGNVEAEITLSETGTITNNNGSGYYEFINNGNFIFEFEDEAGNTGAFIASVDWIDKDVPELSVITGVVVMGADNTPFYSFSSTKSGDITYGGGCSGDISKAISGVNELEFNELEDDTYTNCTIKVTDMLGNESEELDVNSFTIDTEGPNVGFDDVVEELAVGSDMVDVDYDGAIVKKYKLINDLNETCDPSNTYNYTGAITYGDTSENGKKFCIYAEDALGNISTGVSDNSLNIDLSAIVFNFVNPVNVGPVQSNAVSVGGIDLSMIKYELVEDIGDCDINLMRDYLGDMIYSVETHNDKYFCAYAEDSSGRTGLIISANTLNIDITAPTYQDVVDEEYYNISVSPIYNDENGVSATLNGEVFNSNDLVSAEGHYDLVITDEAGNITSLGFDIDKTMPTYGDVEDGGYYNYTINPTFGDNNAGVSATLNGIAFSSGNPVEDEGSYILIIEDEAGNQVIIDFVIDKTDPVLTGIVDIPSPTNNRNPVLRVGITEPGDISYSGSCNGDLVNGLSGENDITFGPLDDGIYDDCYIGIEDPSGNTGVWLYVNPFEVKTSCDLPRGGSIASGETITAYSTNSVACGESCESEVRSCDAGVLSGSFDEGSCSVSSCGGGGGVRLSRDDCPDGDASPSYYDKTCEGDNDGSGHASGPSYGYECKIDESDYSNELKGAYLYSYVNDITSQCPIQDADLLGDVTRIEMAKMVSVFVTDVIGLEQDYDKVCDFPDISSSLDAQYGYGVTNACQLGLMGIDMDNFKPYELVNRAQFGTVLSRILYGDRHNGFTPYYEKHLAALKTDGVMNNLEDPMMLEKRGYVMLMMQRADNYGLFVGMIPALNGIDALLR